YLNGVEVSRFGMPPGTITHNTFASDGVGNAAYQGPFAISSSSLVAGENVIAVEVHQASADSSDITFGLTLNESHPAVVNETEKIFVRFNELPAVTNNPFWFELINHGTSNVALGGMVISRPRGGSPEYILPPVTLAPGE